MRLTPEREQEIREGLLEYNVQELLDEIDALRAVIRDIAYLGYNGSIDDSKALKYVREIAYDALYSVTRKRSE
jgi:hypothetical protein